MHCSRKTLGCLLLFVLLFGINIHAADQGIKVTRPVVVYFQDTASLVPLVDFDRMRPLLEDGFSVTADLCQSHWTHEVLGVDCETKRVATQLSRGDGEAEPVSPGAVLLTQTYVPH